MLHFSDDSACAQDDHAHDLPPRRRAVAVAGALLVGVVGALGGAVLSSPHASPVCGPGGHPLDLTAGPVVCAHADEAPPGVDVTEPVSTAELKERQGAADAAYQAAE